MEQVRQWNGRRCKYRRGRRRTPKHATQIVREDTVPAINVAIQACQRARHEIVLFMFKTFCMPASHMMTDANVRDVDRARSVQRAHHTRDAQWKNHARSTGASKNVDVPILAVFFCCLRFFHNKVTHGCKFHALPQLEQCCVGNETTIQHFV